MRTGSVSVPLNNLASEPYIHVLCYPSSDNAEAVNRVKELKKIRVSKLIFEGHTKLGNLGLLGKGCVSLVVKAKVSNNFYALKIRRTDANRSTMRREAELQCFVNSIQVGPKFYDVSDNFLLMELVEGESIVSWTKQLKGPSSTARLRAVLLELLGQCFKLDQTGLDHGELSNLEKHVYVGNKIKIIDFETASQNRRVSNVTSAVQNMFIGGSQARKVRRMLRLKETQPIISSVKQYKDNRSLESYNQMLHELKLK